MKKFFLVATIIALISCLIISIGVLAENYIDDDIIKIFNAAKRTNNEDKTVVAIVNGKKIFQETIDFLATGNLISQSTTSLNVDSYESNSDDKNEILEKQIRNAVVLSEAEKLGLTASYEEAEKYTMNNYEMLKEIGGETYNIIKDYIKELEMTEEEYLKKSIEINRNMLTRANLYDNFIKEKNGSYDELILQYESYVNKLIENAQIEYKD